MHNLQNNPWISQVTLQLQPAKYEKCISKAKEENKRKRKACHFLA